MGGVEKKGNGVPEHIDTEETTDNIRPPKREDEKPVDEDEDTLEE